MTDAFAPAAQPRAAVTRFDEEDQEEEVEPGLKGKLSKLRHDLVKSKAERKFNKQFEGDGAPAGDSGPRAALYKGEMGQTQRRAARMHNNGEGASPRAAVTTKQKKSTFSSIVSSKAFIAFGAFAACIALTCVFLYPTAKQYYTEVREHDQLAAELEAVNSRNQELVDEVNSLSTPEGIENRAREDYGWVKEGENSVYVDGISDGAKGSRVSANIAPGSIKAPETWYSPFFDKLFGVNL